jgi:hypothetical protein
MTADERRGRQYVGWVLNPRVELAARNGVLAPSALLPSLLASAPDFRYNMVVKNRA